MYTGITSNPANKVLQHKGSVGGISFSPENTRFTVVDYEVGNDIYAAIAREKQIKGGLRQKKIDLINRSNPESKDLFEE